MRDRTYNRVGKSGLAIALTMAMGIGANAETWVTGDLTNELQVASGETYTLSENDAATLGSKCLHLTGEGTVIGNATFANFTGNVRISNGIFQYDAHGGLGIEGSTPRELKIDGTGTLCNKVYASNWWSNEGGNPSIPLNMKVYLEGDGYQSKGAIFNDANTENIAHNIELTGDTKLASNWKTLQFRYANLKMNGYNITCLPNTTLGLVGNYSIEDPAGDIYLDRGGLYLSDNAYPKHLTESTWYLKDSQIELLSFVGEASGKVTPINFEGDSSLKASGGLPQLDKDKGGRNRLQGDVVLNGDVKLRFEDNTGVALDGVVSGEKGFVWSSGSGYLMLSNPNNTFQGGVRIAGTQEGDTSFKGGLALLGNGALPANGGALTLTNAMLILNSYTKWDTTNKKIDSIHRYDLPQIIVEDGGIISNSNKLSTVSAKSLVKNGDGTLSLLPRMSFDGLAEVNGGTLKLAEAAKVNSGLYWWWQQSDNLIATEENCIGVDDNLTYAYENWPYGGSGAQNDPSFNQCFVYRGYVQIPGEEGTDVKFNFLTSIARTCRITIDDKIVSSAKDNDSGLAGMVKIGNWKRFWIAPAFTMKAGWHKVEIWLANSWDSTRGPQGQNVEVGTDESGNTIYATWPWNFGIGVDWEGRCTTNSANYVKLQDPGDGSVFRFTEPKTTQGAIFNGGIAFAAGTTLDVNNPSGPAVETSALIGSPTIMNGAVHVAATEWRLRKGDIAPNKPLMVTESAALSFGEANADVAVNVDADAIAALKEAKIHSIKILAWANESVKPANKFLTGDTTRASHWLVKNLDDGVYIVDRHYLQISIR